MLVGIDLENVGNDAGDGIGANGLTEGVVATAVTGDRTGTAGRPMIEPTSEVVLLSGGSNLAVAGSVLADTTTIRDAIAEPLAPMPSSLPQIRQATLETVVFTATGRDQSTLTPVRAEQTGRVTATSVNLRAGPGTNFAVIGRAAQNDELVVTGMTDGIWIEVKTPLGQEIGWVHGKYFVAQN